MKFSISNSNNFKIYLHGLIGTDPDVTNINLFYHSIKHYSDLGIRHFYLTLHSRHSGIYIKKFINFAKTEFPKLTFEFDEVICGFKKAKQKSHNFSKVIHNNIMTHKDWMIYIDLDEFHILPKQYDNYYQFLKSCDTMGVNYAKGRWIDRCSSDFTFIEINKETHIEKQFPVSLSQLIHHPSEMKRRKYRKPNKIIFTKSGLLVKDQSHHYTGENYGKLEKKHYPDIININHYRLDTLFKSRYIQREIDKGDKTLSNYAKICKGDCFYDYVKHQVIE